MSELCWKLKQVLSLGTQDIRLNFGTMRCCDLIWGLSQMIICLLCQYSCFTACNLVVVSLIWFVVVLFVLKSHLIAQVSARQRVWGVTPVTLWLWTAGLKQSVQMCVFLEEYNVRNCRKTVLCLWSTMLLKPFRFDNGLGRIRDIFERFGRWNLLKSHCGPEWTSDYFFCMTLKASCLKLPLPAAFVVTLLTSLPNVLLWQTL